MYSELATGHEHRPSDLTFEQMQAITAQFAKYEGKPDPEGHLRSGIVEEVAEYGEAATSETPPSRDDVTGELGDIMWYVSEIARSKQADSHVILDGHQSINTFQANAGELSVPMFDKAGQRLQLAGEPYVALAVAAIRTLDILNPRNESVWRDVEKPSLEITLADLMRVVAHIANKEGITLSDTIVATEEKLKARPREVHVVEKSKGKVMLSSMRERVALGLYTKRVEEFIT